VVVCYLESLANKTSDPQLHRIKLRKPLPKPAFGSPEVQPLYGATSGLRRARRSHSLKASAQQVSGGYESVATEPVNVIIDIEYPRFGLLRLAAFDHAPVKLRDSMK
jgi:hypothetical protein